jgi:hypothetical protein
MLPAVMVHAPFLGIKLLRVLGMYFQRGPGAIPSMALCCMHCNDLISPQAGLSWKCSDEDDEKMT